MKYKFGDIVHYINDKRMPVPDDKYTYIGLEHLDSGSLQVTHWGCDVDIIGQKLIMHKGDILFGRRNTYLKRVAVAPHDGLFSAHGMIWRPKEEIVDRDFFIHFVASDYFLDEAIRISVGSLSPTVNWRDLKELEFEIPSLETQRKLAVLMQAMERTKTAYKNLIAKTDELVKSQFIEMFGDLIKNTKHYEMTPLSQLLLIERGGSPRPIEKYITDSEDGVNWIKIGDAEEGSIYITKTKEKIITEGTKKSRYVEPGDFLLSNSMSFGRPYILTIDGYIHDGWLVLRDKGNVFNKLFLHTMLSSDYAKTCFESMAAGSVVKNLNKDVVGRLSVPVPPMVEQEQFATFLEQSDKSKLAAQQALADLTAAQKALMRQYLG